MTEVKTSPCPLTLTDGAKNEILKLIQEKNVPAEYALRVGVKGGGCSGLSYILGFDEAKDSDDQWLVDGIRVIMDKAHGMYLAGMEVDYIEGLANRGFTFNNPNASETCGCGTSFSA